MVSSTAIACVASVMGLFVGPNPPDSVLLDVSPIYGSTESTGTAGLVTLAFSSDGAEESLTVVISNTTPPELGSDLTAIGFEIPDMLDLDVSFADGGESVFFDTLTFDHRVSPGWLNAPGGYDVMLTSDGSFQGGSGKGAPRAGESQTVVLSLGDSGMTPAELAQTFSQYYASAVGPIAIARFQGVGSGSDMVLAHTPEPATMVLVLAGMSLLRRRRQ